MLCLSFLLAARVADVPDTTTTDLGRVVAIGTTRRVAPATGRLIVARFRHVWRVLDRRVVSVHRSDDGPDGQTSERSALAPC